MPDSTSPKDSAVHLHRVGGVEDDDDVLEVRGDRIQHSPLGLIEPQVLLRQVRKLRAGAAEHDESRVGVRSGRIHLLLRDVLDGHLIDPVALDIAEEHVDEPVAGLRERVARLPVLIDGLQIFIVLDAAVFQAFIEVDRFRRRDRPGPAAAEEQVAGGDAEDVHFFVLERQKVPGIFEEHDAFVLHLSGDRRRRFQLLIRDAGRGKGRQQRRQDQAEGQDDRQDCFSMVRADRGSHSVPPFHGSFSYGPIITFSAVVRMSCFHLHNCSQ